MTNKERDEGVKLANDLENSIAFLDCNFEYKDIVKLALNAAKQIRKEFPTHEPRFNNKWEVVNFTVQILEGRLNGGLAKKRSHLITLHNCTILY